MCPRNELLSAFDLAWVAGMAWVVIGDWCDLHPIWCFVGQAISDILFGTEVKKIARVGWWGAGGSDPTGFKVKGTRGAFFAWRAPILS